MPAFKGLFPLPYDNEVQDLLYVLSYFHALIRSRVHTDTTVDNVEHEATPVLGTELRRFATSICTHFEDKTVETKAEAASRMRRAAAVAKKTGNGVPDGTSTRRSKKYNIRTLKIHRMGHYGSAIRRTGPMDNVDSRHVSPVSHSRPSSDQAQGEAEHASSKAMYRRGAKDKATGQIVKIGVIEHELSIQAAELRFIGVEVLDSDGKWMTHTSSDAAVRPDVHHYIAEKDETRRTRHQLGLFLADKNNKHANEPAIKVSLTDICMFLYADSMHRTSCFTCVSIFWSANSPSLPYSPRCRASSGCH
jgi:hypothetical protein